MRVVAPTINEDIIPFGEVDVEIHSVVGIVQAGRVPGVLSDTVVYLGSDEEGDGFYHLYDVVSGMEITTWEKTTLNAGEFYAFDNSMDALQKLSELSLKAYKSIERRNIRRVNENIVYYINGIRCNTVSIV